MKGLPRNDKMGVLAQAVELEIGNENPMGDPNT
jgi:hypothetical protein